MVDLFVEISKADAFEIEGLLKAVLARYAELFPDWEVGAVSLQKTADRNEQIDRMIAMLQNMKTTLK